MVTRLFDIEEEEVLRQKQLISLVMEEIEVDDILKLYSIEELNRQSTSSLLKYYRHQLPRLEVREAYLSAQLSLSPANQNIPFYSRGLLISGNVINELNLNRTKEKLTRDNPFFSTRTYVSAA